MQGIRERVLAAFGLVLTLLALLVSHAGRAVERDPAVSTGTRDLFALPETERGSCPALQACPRQLHPKLWAQQAIGAKAAVRRLKSLGISLSPVSVAVVDSGFDLVGRGGALTPAVTSLKDAQGVELPLAKATDDIGHGTSVSSLIAGKNGVGVAPGVRVQPYTAYDSTLLRFVDDQKAVEKACDQGHAIINLSLGSNADQAGVLPLEVESKDWLDRLRAKGCLVIQSAGNGAFRDRESYLSAAGSPSLDDSLLRVAATRPWGGEAVFSSPGEVRAPGEDVFTYFRIGTALDGLRLQDSCDLQQAKLPQGMIDGTSFAAPIVTGVAALVRAVLLTDPNYVGSSGALRVQILSHLIHESQTTEGVHALRAVELALLFRSKSRAVGALKAMDSLRDGSLTFELSQSKGCQQPDAEAQSCRARASSCQATFQCAERLADAEAICGPSVGRSRAQMELAFANGDLEGALRHLRRGVRVEEFVGGGLSDPSRQFAKRLLHRYLKTTAGMRRDLRDLSRSIEFFSVALRALPSEGREASELLALFLRTARIEDAWGEDSLGWIAGASAKPGTRSYLFELSRLGELLKSFHDRLTLPEFKQAFYSGLRDLTGVAGAQYEEPSRILARLTVLGALIKNRGSHADGSLELRNWAIEEVRRQTRSTRQHEIKISPGLLSGMEKLISMDVISPRMLAETDGVPSELEDLLYLRSISEFPFINTVEISELLKIHSRFLERRNDTNRTLVAMELVQALFQATSKVSAYQSTEKEREELRKIRDERLLALLQTQNLEEVRALLQVRFPDASVYPAEIDRFALDWHAKLFRWEPGVDRGVDWNRLQALVSVGDHLVLRSHQIPPQEYQQAKRDAQNGFKGALIELRRSLSHPQAAQDWTDGIARFMQGMEYVYMLHGGVDLMGWRSEVVLLKRAMEESKQTAPRELRYVIERLERG